MDFDTPLRVTWNVTAGVSDRVFARVAEELALAGVMEVKLRVRPGQLTRRLGRLAALAQGRRLDLVLPGEAATPGSLNRLVVRLQAAGVALSSLTLDWTARLRQTPEPLADLPPLGASVREVGETVRLALELVPERTTLPAALKMARQAPGLGFAEVRLSHPDLIGHSAYQVRREVLTPDLLRRAGGVFRAGSPLPVKPLIHDLFLREALLGAAEGYGGCQAANAMAHVDGSGRVYPCSALPVPLGDLRLEGFVAIWSSPRREALRRRLVTLDGVCAGCGRRDQCRGGCRGLAYFLTGDWTSPDPSCPGPA